MTPDWAVSHFDDPVYAKAMCDMLAAKHAGWIFSRADDRRWRARHQTWPEDVALQGPDAAHLHEIVRHLVIESPA